MNRHHFLRTAGLGLLSLPLMNNRAFAWHGFDPAWNIKMLTPEIGVFTERGGTIVFMLSAEGNVVVDTQFPEQAQHLIEELKKQQNKPYRLLINTHHHGDHSAGNIAFKGLVQQVVAHELSRVNQQRVATAADNDDKQLYPDTVFTSDWKMKVGTEQIALHYFGPAHTNGDIFVHFTNANIVHCGDLVANRRHPYVDRSAGANMASWLKVLDKAMTTFDNKTRFVCGHAADGFDVVASMEDVKRFQHYLASVLSYVETAVKTGKTKEELLKTTIIPDAPEWKGDGLQRPLTAAYEEITSR